MIRFFQTPLKTVIATEVDHQLSDQEIKELNWLYGEATLLDAEQLDGYFVGPRREMVMASVPSMPISSSSISFLTPDCVMQHRTDSMSCRTN